MTYYDGLVNGAKGPLALFTGPGIDPDNARFIHYIALEICRSWNFVRGRKIQSLLSELDALLRQHGAEAVLSG